MLLRKIKLKNFRQYYGEVVINFATDKIKNVTVIHAENGVGKTALLNAIKWCFYGEFTTNFRNPQALLNFEADKDGASKCSVEIEFENGGEEFLINRVFDKSLHQTKSYMAGNLRVYKISDGTMGTSLPEPELVVNGMLPKEMADYFFFQGEGSNAVEVGNKGINLAKSIRNILGFRIAEVVEETLRKQILASTKKIAELDNSGEASELAKQVEAISNKKHDLEVDILALESKIPELQAQFEAVELELLQINNQDLNSLKKEETDLEQTLQKLEREHKDSLVSKFKTVSKFGWAIFGKEFAEESLEFIDESTWKGRLPEPYNETFINDILAAARCICGQSLEAGSEHYINIAKLLDKAANPTLQNRFGGIRAQIQSIKTINSVASDAITGTLQKTDSLEAQIQHAKNRLKLIHDKIVLIPEEKISSLQNKRKAISSDLGSQHQMFGGYKVRIESFTKDLESKQKRLNALRPNDELLGDLALQQKFFEDIKNYLSEHLSSTEKRVRLHIVEKVNEMMKSFSRHAYEIRASSSDFSIHLVRSDGTSVGQGDGLNLLLNLSITAALIEFVKENQKVRDPLLTSATVAPLVIDAPFGVLDDSYRNVVVSSLPKHAEQVMFFVSSSQWREEMNSVVKARIGAEYCLILEEAGDQGDKPLDIFNINGKEIVANRYGCERDRVLALEVSNG